MTDDHVRALVAALDQIGGIADMLSLIEDRLLDHQNIMCELTYTEAGHPEQRVLRVSN